MNEEQTSYKVTDRRLFNPDGTPRDVPENERPEPTPVKPEAAHATASASPEPPVADAGAAKAGVAEVPPAPASADLEADSEEADLPDADDPASLASFLMSFASHHAASSGMSATAVS